MLERTVKTTDALGNETNTTYDAMGRVSTVSGKIDGGDGVTAYTYDGNGNVIKESVTSNKPGETTAYRNTYYQYDSMNRLIKTNTDEPGETLYEYDDNGNVTKMTTGAVNGTGGVSTTYEYDSQNRLAKTTDPMGYTETYTYDNNGNVASMTDKNGTVTTNTYNAVNSLLTSVAGNETISYTYKPYSGRQSAVTNSAGTISYTYNTKGQLTGETSTAENAAKTYTYDKDGNQTNITVTKNNNQIINQTASYNYVGNMTSVYDNKEEKTLANYSYDGNGNMIEKKTADGMHKTVYDYNESNLLTKVENMTIYDKETNQFGSYSSYEYEYYLDGNRSKETENTGKNKEYTYDGAGRLLTESIASKDQENKIQTVYEYDARGNRISKESISYGVSLMEWTGPRPSYDDGEGYTSYWYDDNNRLTCIKYDYDEYMNEDIDYTYDNNGNMIGRERVIYYDDFPPIGSSYEEYEVESEEFEYNDFSQLIGYDSEENDIRNGTIKEMIASYAYDGKGQRVKKTLNGKTIEYVWDGSGNIIGENEKVYSRGAGGEIVSDGENYYAYNGHGDTTNLVQMSSGTAIALTATYEYDAFGNLINGSETGETRENSFRYNGQYTDDETGLIYLRNRYYDPSIGRFTQEDPAKDGANWYVYCGNNPVAFVDPSGLTIILQRTDEEIKQSLEELQMLTNDYIDINQDGEVVIISSGTMNTDYDLATGTELVASLINNKEFDCVIVRNMADEDGNKYSSQTFNYRGSYSSVITINDDEATEKALTVSATGERMWEQIPDYIKLGHEMIHAFRFMNDEINYGRFGYRFYFDENNKLQYESSSELYKNDEEFDVVGLTYYHKGQPMRVRDAIIPKAGAITENALRAERGLPQRAAYGTRR